MATVKWRCVNSKNFVSNAISFVSRGVVCHVEFLFDDVQIGNTIYHNVCIGAHADGGVRVRTIDKYDVDYRFKAECTDEQYAKLLAFITAQIGKPYDFLDIFGIMASRNWHDDSRWICSEFWVVGMETAELIHKIESDVALFTPQDSLLVSSAMFERDYAAVV